MRLSLQLYTVRDQLASDPVGTLTKVREIGLEYVEGGGSFGAATPKEGRKVLDDLGLKASGAHVGLDVLEGSLSKAIDDANTLGHHYVIVPWVGGDVYADGWDKFGKRLEAIGVKVRDAGLNLLYHNHDFEFKNPGKSGLKVLFESTDSGLVKSELDIAWVQIGGGDPATYIRELRSRLPLVHLKDFDPDKTPRWRPCGQGLVDWDGCLAAIAEGEVEFGAIELDESPGDPIQAVRESYEFFKSKGLR
jgi:sugar phosphate isomerase/epimerase